MSRLPLRRIASMSYGDALAAQDRVDGSVPVMSSGGVTGRHDRANTSGPTIVVGRKGSHGSVWWSPEPAFVIDTAYSIDRSNTSCDLRWLYYALQSLGLDGLSNDVGVPGLSRESAYEAGVNVVGIDEQRRIADFLDDRVARIDQIITAREDQIAHLDALARSSLATNLLVKAEETIALRYLIEDERLGIWGDEPGQSEVDVTVARVADFVRSDFRLGEAPTVRSVSKSQLGVRVLRHGDVLLERSGGTHVNPVGCPAFVDSPTSPTVSSNFVSRLRPTSDTDGRYLSLVLGALYSTRQQAPHSTQTTGIQNLDTGSYFSMRVPQETLRAQRAAAARADSMLSTTRRYRQELRLAVSHLTEFKQSLITAAVTGELDVTTAGSGIPG